MAAAQAWDDRIYEELGKVTELPPTALMWEEVNKLETRKHAMRINVPLNHSTQRQVIHGFSLSLLLTHDFSGIAMSTLFAKHRPTLAWVCFVAHLRHSRASVWTGS
jgi:hypothetical protein